MSTCQTRPAYRDGQHRCYYHAIAWAWPFVFHLKPAIFRVRKTISPALGPHRLSDAPRPADHPARFSAPQTLAEGRGGRFCPPNSPLRSTSPAEPATTPRSFSSRIHPLITAFQSPLTKRTLGAAAADSSELVPPKISRGCEVAKEASTKYSRCPGL